MKEFFKRNWVSVLVLVLAILGWLKWGGMVTENSELKKEKDRMAQNYESSQDSVKRVLNSMGDSVYQIKALRLRVDELKEFNSDLYMKLGKLGNQKKVVNYTGVKSKTEDSLFIPHEDTVYITDKNSNPIELPFKYSDSFLYLSGITTNRGTDIFYRYTSELDILYFWDKDRRLKVNISSKNPKEVITGVTALDIEPPRQGVFKKGWFWFGIGSMTTAGGIYFLTR